MAPRISFQPASSIGVVFSVFRATLRGVVNRSRLIRALSVSVCACVAILIATQACDWNGMGARPEVSEPPSLLVEPAVLAAPPLFDLSGKKSLTVYWVLGFLDEYVGRQAIDDGDLVETLYCNEHDKLERLRTMLRRLLREQRLTDDLREELVQECLPVFRSAELARELNSMYVSREAVGMFDTSGGRRRQIVVLKATQAMFERVGDNERVAYLAGAYYRYGHEGAFVFANAGHKADLIADLLDAVGVKAIERHTVAGLPNGNTVRFGGLQELQALFAQVMP